MTTYLVSSVGDGENVRWQIAKTSILIKLNIFWIIDRIESERIDSDQYRTNISVDVAFLEASLVHKVEKNIVIVSTISNTQKQLLPLSFPTVSVR